MATGARARYGAAIKALEPRLLLPGSELLLVGFKLTRAPQDHLLLTNRPHVCAGFPHRRR